MVPAARQILGLYPNVDARLRRAWSRLSFQVASRVGHRPTATTCGEGADATRTRAPRRKQTRARHSGQSRVPDADNVGSTVSRQRTFEECKTSSPTRLLRLCHPRTTPASSFAPRTTAAAKRPTALGQRQHRSRGAVSLVPCGVSEQDSAVRQRFALCQMQGRRTRAW
jgi:hypothetical protein